MPGRMAQQIAVAFALCAFSVAIATGLLTGAAPGGTLVRSVVVLALTYPTGRVLGAALQAALNEHLTAMTAANPIPEAVVVESAGRTGQAGAADVLDDVETV